MRTVGVALFAAVAAACGETSGPAVTVTDSAGVRITVTEDTPHVYARLESEPFLSIGGPDAAGPTQLFQIQGIHVDPGGRLWIADGESSELRIFLADGSHWKTRGGRGEGPGEFVRIRLLGAVAGDTVLLGDGGLDRISVFDPDGEFVRAVRLPSGERAAPRPFDVFDDGSVLGQLPRIVPAASIEPDRVLTDSVELVRVTPGSSGLEPYGVIQGPLWLWTGRSQVLIPFTVNASFDVAGDEVHIASGAAFRIRVLAGGTVREAYGVDRAARRVGRTDIAAYRAFVDEYIPEPTRAEYLSALENERVPDVLPAYDRVVATKGGGTWAQVYDPDFDAAHEWDVYDGDRRFVGSIRTPAGLQPMVITRDAVVGVWRDENGVEYVRGYRFGG